jgi:gliding motility-associated-like protein
MRKYSLFILLTFSCFISNGQGLSVKLTQADTTLCRGNNLILYPTVSIGTFRFIGTYGGSDYFVDTVSRSWTQARAEAKLNGMDLWVIDSSNENNFVYYNLLPNRTKPDTYFWFGLYQNYANETPADAGRGWFWIDGRSMDTTFTSWYASEPNDIFATSVNANFASLGLNNTVGQWSDMPDAVPAQYKGYAIAEIPHTDMKFLWTNASTGSAIYVSPNINDSYAVTINYLGNSATSNTTNVTIIEPKGNSAFDVDAASVTCSKQNNIIFKNTSINTDPLISYKWDFGDGQFSTQNSVVHNYSGADTFSVTLTATDNVGCKTIATKPIIILASPTNPFITFTPGSNIFCAGDSVFLTTVVTQDLNNFSSYKWTLGGSTVSTTNKLSAKLGGTYIVEAINTNGCKDSSSISVTVNSLPAKPTLTPYVGYTNSFCQVDSTKLEATTSSFVNKYAWYTGSSLSPVLITGAAQKIYFVKGPATMGSSPINVNYFVRAIDSRNCFSAASDSLVVTIKPTPAASITASGAPTTFCESDSVVLFDAQSTITAVREWTRDNIIFDINVNSVAVNTSGVYRLRITNSFACPIMSNPIAVTVNKFPLIPSIIPDPSVPEITPTGQLNICTGSNTTLRTSSVSGGSYQWYYNGGIITNAKSISITANKAGNYKVITTVNGCAAPSAETVVDLLPLPNGTLVVPAVTALCDGYTVTMNATNAFSYQWYLNNTKIFGANSADYEATNPGVYKVEFVTDKGCKSMSLNFVNLSLIKKPTAAFTYDLYCINVPASFTNQSVTANSGTVNYLWSFQNGSTDSSINAVHTYSKSGLYRVNLSVIPAACPQLTDSISANINVEQPSKGVTYTPINTLLGKPVSLIARSFGDSYQWRPSTGLNSPFIRIPILTPTTEQLYTIQITNRAGCLTVDSVLVRIFDESDVFVAGGFTPNNDGNNDRVYPILAGISSFSYFKIYNRWGVVVYQSSSTDPAQGWDGRYKGKDQPADTYSWVILAEGNNGRVIARSGSLILIR